jgi:hypothetical protein
MDQTQQPVEPGQARADAGLGALFDFSFTRFITLSIIKILYILGIVLIALGWLAIVISGLSQGFGPGLVALIIGTLAALVYLIFFRISLELIVVIFRIGENTTKIAASK